MSFIYFAIGGFFRFVMMAIFAVRSYEKGYHDGWMDAVDNQKDAPIDFGEYQQYKKQLADFSHKINPKLSSDERIEVRSQYLEKRIN